MSSPKITDVVILPASTPDPHDLHVREATMLLRLRQEMVHFGRTEEVNVITLLLNLLGWEDQTERKTD